MGLMIFDIDGTLTHVYGEIENTTEFSTYAFWPLLSYEFSENPAALKKIATEWDGSDKGAGEVFIESSRVMLERGIRMFRQGITGETLRIKAREITFQFIKQAVIRPGAIEFLTMCIDRGHRCAFSTGSYEEGALGFLDALMEAKLLTQEQGRKIIVSGAVIHWPSRTVSHANIAGNKIVGLKKRFLEKTGVLLNPTEITGIYVDDPEGNDSGLYNLKPDKVFVMKTNRILDEGKLTAKGGTIFTSWKLLSCISTLRLD